MAQISVVYRNLDEDSGVDYVLTSGRPDCSAIRIATLEGEYEGPGISWSELLYAADYPFGESRSTRILLLAPMLGDLLAATDEGIAVISQAIVDVGGTGDRVEELAALIARENLQWEPANWSELDDGTMVCDSEASPRNPDSNAALSRNKLQIVSNCLNP